MLPSVDNVIGNSDNRRFVFITDQTAGRTGFLLHHFIGQGIKNDKKVVVMGFENSFGHYHSVASKLGLNLIKAKESGSFQYIDGAAKILNSVLELSNTLRPSSGLEELYNEIISVLTSPGTLLIIDNISILQCLGFSHRDINMFVQKLRNHTKSLEGLFVCCASSDAFSTEHANYLSRISDLGLSVDDLSTGKSRDVSGHLTVNQRKEDGSQNVTGYHFRIEDRSVKIFPPGTSSAVL
eukprot:TRINITY_DN21306_c0_g1_i1.p1 TRINITY_DN21306_c0_g1~~TRINITY_DN21306_c0_g1_i1.p1  ORF type:complete len:238 (-),score=22.97 TRINITY_DN21306_c0_g1_i1:200-913(-)